MTATIDLFNAFLPLLALVFFTLGLVYRQKHFSHLALGLSLLALIINYQASAGEILGSYFNYKHAATYSFTILLFLSAMSYILWPGLQKKPKALIEYFYSVIAFLAFTSGFLLMSNLWINAYFIEEKKQGSPILQVAGLQARPYCDFSYVFYKVDEQGQLYYLCPNHYGLLPSIGALEAAPEHLLRHLKGLTKKA